MDQSAPGRVDLERGFIVDGVRPAHKSHLAFLGEPRPAPFQGSPVKVLRGSDRVFGPPASVEAGLVAAVAPRLGDATGMAGQVFGTESHDPRTIVNQEAVFGGLGGPDDSRFYLPGGEVDFAARVRQCWPRVMAGFMDMMQAPIEGATDGGDHG